ncbi:MAG: amidohydrolase family protein [Proteobacteria bacterium]|nr:amidohydrolase family protein [Pseudomonadota bacterium]
MAHLSPNAPTVDADGHVLEPRDTWINYLPSKYRDRAIRIERDQAGDEVLLFDGKPLEVARNRLATLGGVDMDPSEVLRPGRYSYEDGCPLGGYDPTARLKVMDAEGIDIALLYPTIGICWEGHVCDPELAHAYTEAYNRWLVDFCSAAPKRLVPVAHINLLDIKLAVSELQRAHAAGCRGIYISPDLFARGQKRFDDHYYDPFWAAAAERELPVAFHVVVRDQATTSYVDPYNGGGISFGLLNFAFLAIDVMGAFTELMSAGVLERFPKLKVAVLETGANWISAWLDRLDHKYEVIRSVTRLKMKPSDYFRRQCLVSADPDESMTAEIVRHVGAAYFVWASDYPHIDASMGVVAEMRRHLAVLPQTDQQLVMGGNAVRFYGLDK